MEITEYSPPTREEVQARIRQLNDDLSRDRGELLRLQAAQRTARGVVADRLMEWQTNGQKPVSREELIRQHIASEQQRKADTAAGRISPHRSTRLLRSEIDKMAHWTATNGQRAGGGNSFRRGATTRRGAGDDPCGGSAGPSI